MADKDLHDEDMDLKEEEKHDQKDDKGYLKTYEELETELKQSNIEREELQTRIDALEHALSFAFNKTATITLHQTLANTKQELDATKEKLDAVGHRLHCSNQREEESIGRVAESFKREVTLQADLRDQSRQVAKRDEIILELEEKIKKLQAEAVKRLAESELKSL